MLSHAYQIVRRRSSGGSRVADVFLGAALFVAITGLVIADEPPAPVPDARPVPRVGVILRLDGPITPLTEHYVARQLERAKAAGADLVVLEIDSPGGQLNASLQIAITMRDLGWARTVAFVPREALSGAAIAALGCDEIVMHPQAKLGDAGPIYMNEAGMFEHAPEKIRSHLARHLRDLAQSKGRPPAVAEAMVDKDLDVFRVRNRETGAVTYRSESEMASDPQAEQWERLEAVQEAHGTNFLEVNGERAVELKLASAVAADHAALRDHVRLPRDWIVLQPTFTDTAVYVLNRPLITGLLIVIGLVALYVELSAPGIGAGGIVALLCFVLFFWSRFLGGTSGWLEVFLFLLGGGCIAIEIFVLPGFGVTGFLGLILIASSLLMASQSFVIPRSSEEIAAFSQSLFVLVGSLGLFLVLAAAISRYFGSLPVFSRLVLAAPAHVDVDKDADVDKPDERGATEWAMGIGVGDWGVAETPLRPAGKARFEDRLVDVVTDGAFIDRGQQIRVVERQGNRIVVVQVS